MKKLLTISLLFLIVTVLSGCKPSLEEEIIFDLISGDEIFFEVGESYYDPGIIVKHNSEDISSYVTVSGQANTALQGEYEITYTLEYEGVTITKTRTVLVGGFDFDCEEVEELIVQEFDPSDPNDVCEIYSDSDYLACQVIWTTYLNTVVKLTIYIDQDSTFNTNEAFHEVETLLARYTMISDKYKEYGDVPSVCTINKNNGGTTSIDQDLFDLIDYTLESQAPLSDYYDATMGTVLSVWHTYRDTCNNGGECKVPSASILDAADKYTGSQKVILSEIDTSITLEEDTTIDLGGISKGYVTREIVNYLDSLDIHGYLLNNGESNISIGGTHPVRENGKYIIALTNPENLFDYYATVFVSDGEQLVTSGDYQKYYNVDGELYHHIIDPITLMPLSNSRSVSIITSDPALADLYSTAIFNMTIEEGITFVDSVEGLEAIWFAMDGTIHFSQNFEANHLNELQ